MTTNNRQWRTRVPTDKYMLTIADTGKILGISDRSIRHMMREGIIPAVKIGRRWVTDRDKLNAWLTSLYTARFGAGDGGRQGGSDQGREGPAGSPPTPGPDREGGRNLR